MSFIQRLHWSQQGQRLHPVRLLCGAIAVSLLMGCVGPAESAGEASSDSDREVNSSPEWVPDQVSDQVLRFAAIDLQVPQDELSTLRVNQETWQDSCLGLGRLNESCLFTLVPGWQLEVVYDDQSYFYRSDETGEVIRRSTLENNLPPSIAEKILVMAASELGTSVSQVSVAAAEPRVWDGCLGIVRPGIVCAQIAIFGWRAVVEGHGKTLIYHSDMTGHDIRPNDLE